MYHVGEEDPMYSTLLGEALKRYEELTNHEYPNVISAEEAEKLNEAKSKKTRRG